MTRLTRIVSLALVGISATALGAVAGPVVKVGTESLDSSAVQSAFRRVPAFQLQALGPGDAERRRAIVERWLVPALAAAAEARARGVDRRPRTDDRLRELYSRAMDAELALVTEREQPVTDQDVRRYFDEHRAEFELPRRIRIWRILVGDEQLAKRIISESQGASGPARWRNFARESSLDAATKFRDGDLGFVRPDGSTDTPTLRVDPALFAAVDQLSDGEIAPAPLQSSSGYAVVWRRGSLPAISRTAAEEGPAIRTLLTRQRLEAARRALVERLRREYLRELDSKLLETLPDSSFAPPASRPGSLPPYPSASAAPAGAETPRPGPDGTR